ncbi:MAG: adenosine deaminase [Proteobacteria bacterium]|nr:adenosine deaminase [Pseudomonadota bacterium]
MTETTKFEITEEFLRAIPKTDLHCHLDGSLRPATILDLADKQGVQMPANDVEGLRKAMRAGEMCDDLVDYLRAFDITCKVLQNEEGLRRAAFEVAEDAAKENVRYLEVRYAPILHTNQGLRLDQIVQAVLDGLNDAERKYDIKTGLIICGIRNMTPETSLRIAELAVAFKNRGVVGFDLAGAEHNNPAKDHREAFYLIRNNNINVTIHAGEAYGPESIHQAIHMCGSQRIGHGTRLKESGDLLNFVNDHRIPLEVCLKSNLQTRATPSLSAHPFRFYLDLGLRVTLNTDNRLVTDTTVTDEYLLAVKHFDLNLDHIRWLMVNGFKSSFLPFREKRILMRRVVKEFEELVVKHSNRQKKPKTKKSDEPPRAEA